MRKIVIDLLGADNGQEPLIEGALNSLLRLSDYSLVLIGDESLIKEYIIKMGADEKRIEIIDSHDFISNTESPMAVFRGRATSSLSLAYKKLKQDEEAVALVSAGNTGAVLIGSMFNLGLIEGVKHPALATPVPNYKGEYTMLLDCGANVDCDSDMLLEFAHLGSAAASALLGVDNPRVSLLSVGKEDRKGNRVTKEAFEKLKASNLNFIGNAEGYEIVNAQTDVIVCDGFSGNVALKLCEATGKMTVGRFKNLLKGKEAEEAIAEVYAEFDFNTRAGAIMLGSEKVIVKAHGSANPETLSRCIVQAATLVSGGLSQKLKEAAAKL